MGNGIILCFPGYDKLRVILLGMSQSASGDPAAEQYQEIYLQLDELLEREGSL